MARALAHSPPKPAAKRTPDPLIGRVVADRYRIVGPLGRGGMGVVYEVEHLRIGKPMAMKLLSGDLSRNREVVRRFKREALAASRLGSVNTVQVWDFGHADGLTYLVMELVAGEDLGRLLEREGPMPFARVAQIAAQVCNSMEEAHERGIVHRDLKPENILVLHPGARQLGDLVKVLDFGLAKLQDEERAHDNGLTHAGAIVGTPFYMSPEQIRGEPVDGRSDIYALGAVMYRAVVGEPPFSGSTPMAVLAQHLTEPVVPPSERVAELAPEADAIITKCLAKRREERYANATELRADLMAFLGTSESSGRSFPRLEVERNAETRRALDAFDRHRRRVSFLVAVIGVVLVLALILYARVVWRRAPGVCELTPPGGSPRACPKVCAGRRAPGAGAPARPPAA